LPGAGAIGACVGYGPTPMSDDYERDLGVVEAITLVKQQCPNGSVGDCAEQALAAIREGGAAVLPEQAFFVLSAIRGWRGPRASQVARSLRAFLASSGDGASQTRAG
jgi:hypothetical protein